MRSEPEAPASRRLLPCPQPPLPRTPHTPDARGVISHPHKTHTGQTLDPGPFFLYTLRLTFGPGIPPWVRCRWLACALKRPPKAELELKMAEVRTDLYEGLFLLSNQHASADLAGCLDFLKEVFNRAEAEVIVLRRWEDRKLAYEIKTQKRGVYILTYFNARRSQIANIERDCNLSEHVVRALIIRADHLGETEIELAKQEALTPVPAPAPEKPKTEGVEAAPAQA